MSDRLNDAEREEAKNEVVAQVRIASELADLSLANLELRSNPSIIRVNGRALDRMTENDLSVVKSISARLTKLQTNAEFVKTYTLEQFQKDFLAIASLLSGSLKTEFVEKVQAINETQFTQIKNSLLASIKNRPNSAAPQSTTAAAEAEKARQAAELAGFSPEKASFLTLPDLKMATLVSQVEAQGGTDTEKMQRLQDRISRKLFAAYSEWINEVRPLMEGKNGSGLTTFESGLAEDQLGVQTTSTQTIGKMAGAVGNAAGNVFGDFSQFKFTLLNQHPLLGNIFNTKEAITAGYAGLTSSTSSAETMISSRVESIMQGLTFEQISSKFVLISDNLTDASVTVEQLQALEGKMETVPKFFRNKDFASQYYDYLRESVGGDLTMAKSFKEWFKTVDMHPLMKMFYQFIMMIPDEIMDYFDGKEADKTDTEKNGADLQAIKDELGRRTASDATDAEAAAAAAAGSTEEGRNTYLDGLSNYKTLRDDYRGIMGNPNARPSIIHNGEPLGTTPLTPEEKAYLTNISAMIRLEPSSAQLLTRNLELSDMNFLAEHTNDVNSDGVNVEFTPVGMRVYADLQYFLPEGFTTWFDREWLTGSVVAGSAASVAVFSGVFWPIVLGGIAAGGVAYTILEGVEMTMSKSNYGDLEAGKLARMVAQVSESMKALKAATTKRVNQLQDIPVSERTQVLESSGFLELQEDLPEFWGNYKLTSVDVLLFNEFENGSGDFSFDESGWFNIFHADNIDAGDEYIDESGEFVTATSDTKGFQVEGTGSWFGGFTDARYADHRFKNVASFFAWLRTSPKAAEFEAKLAASPTT